MLCRHMLSMHEALGPIPRAKWQEHNNKKNVLSTKAIVTRIKRNYVKIRNYTQLGLVAQAWNYSYLGGWRILSSLQSA